MAKRAPKQSNKDRLAMLAKHIEAGARVYGSTGIGELLGLTRDQRRGFVEYLLAKKLITWNQFGMAVLLGQPPAKALAKLSQFDNLAARSMNPGATKDGRPMRTKRSRPEGWLRTIMMGEDVTKAVEATPSDPVLAQQIVESKGSANQEREPIKFRKPRALGQPRRQAASQPRLLADPVLAPPAARERRLAMLERQELLDLQREVELKQQRLENRRRAKHYKVKRKEKRCLQCENLAHRRPVMGKCRCGKRFEPEGVGIEIVCGSSMSNCDSW